MASLLLAILAFSHFAFLATASAEDYLLVSGPGSSAIIPWWHVELSTKVGNDVTAISDPSFFLESVHWYEIGSKGTWIAAILEDKSDSTKNWIFKSDNLKKLSKNGKLDKFYRHPVFYRTEFDLRVDNSTHFQLKTHGISSKADIYLNGVLVANKTVQAGAYAGHTYGITGKAKTGVNVLLVRVYPTDYNRDFALGFVDWNPYPPDNGTGIWRDVEVKQTGPFSFTGTPRINTDLTRWDGQGNVTVTVNIDVQSLEDRAVAGKVDCIVVDPQGSQLWTLSGSVEIAANSIEKISLRKDISAPQMWFPRQWGSQPLYSTSCKVSVNQQLSDMTPEVRFGLRTVTSTLNKFNDTMFFINGQPFQVLGAGYTSDIFLRFDEDKLRTQFQYVLDMGLNTVRLEGKQEHPRFFKLADEMGIMIMAGWECCDKWEGWSYNDEGSGEKWKDVDYAIANVSMRHEAEWMQHHPSMLAFLVGSDFWPDDRATRIYVDALNAFNWDVPIIASASQRGYPDPLGNGGMKMDGPYDWIPPNYWYTDQLGAAFGFGSELGAGVGTPELRSLKRFLSKSDREDLWKRPTKGLYHMSTNVSSFYTRTIYNEALWTRFGPPTSLENYLLKAQMMDYEATRAQFEAYAVKWTAERPATGMVYWMLNNAWPSLHWNLFDYYLHPAGSYFGTKVGARPFHVAYDYITRSVHLINRSAALLGSCNVYAELIDLNGTKISSAQESALIPPNNSTKLFKFEDVHKIRDVGLLKLVLTKGTEILSRNVYHLSRELDKLDFDNSTWYHTPVTRYANFTALNSIPQADIIVKTRVIKINGADVTVSVKLYNNSKVPAVFIRLNLVSMFERKFLPDNEWKSDFKDVVPVRWSDNYVTLWPGENLTLEVSFTDERELSGELSEFLWVEAEGWNVAAQRAGISIAGSKTIARAAYPAR